MPSNCSKCLSKAKALFNLRDLIRPNDGEAFVVGKTEILVGVSLKAKSSIEGGVKSQKCISGIKDSR
jgi:hypothetical protein